ncbi:hypothetical protein SRHO_G00090990 [Serrasalmus rhombeus]
MIISLRLHAEEHVWRETALRPVNEGSSLPAPRAPRPFLRSSKETSPQPILLARSLHSSAGSFEPSERTDERPQPEPASRTRHGGVAPLGRRARAVRGAMQRAEVIGVMKALRARSPCAQ